MTEDIKPGVFSHTFTFTDDGGHFEKGRWVNRFSSLFEFIRDTTPMKEPTFDAWLKVDVPVFQKGICIGYNTEDRFLGAFTQSEMRNIFPKTNGPESPTGEMCYRRVNL